MVSTVQSLVGLAEPVAAIRDRETSVSLCFYHQPVGGAVVHGWRTGVRVATWLWHGSQWHCGGLIVDEVCDEHPRYRVLLPTQHREVQLPKVFQAGRCVQGSHRSGCAALASSIVHERHAGCYGVNQGLRV